MTAVIATRPLRCPVAAAGESSRVRKTAEARRAAYAACGEPGLLWEARRLERIADGIERSADVLNFGVSRLVDIRQTPED